MKLSISSWDNVYKLLFLILKVPITRSVLD